MSNDQELIIKEATDTNRKLIQDLAIVIDSNKAITIVENDLGKDVYVKAMDNLIAMFESRLELELSLFDVLDFLSELNTKANELIESLKKEIGIKKLIVDTPSPTIM